MAGTPNQPATIHHPRPQVSIWATCLKLTGTQVAEDVCPDATQIVDGFHAVMHLSDASHSLYPDEKDEKKRKRWLKTYKNHLYRGRIHKIIVALSKRGHDDLTTYFERHQRRMQYHQFREEGFPIGSGMVESGVK